MPSTARTRTAPVLNSVWSALTSTNGGMRSVSVPLLFASVHFSHGSTLVPRKAPIAGCFVPDAKPFPQIALPPLFSLIRRAQPLSGYKKGTGPGGEVQAARAASNRKRVVLGRVLI